MDRKLRAAEEEELVVDNRSSDRSAELVPFERIANRCEEVSRVENPIAYELEKVPVKFVGAGLGYDVDRAGTVLPVLRRQSAGLDLELLKRVGEGSGRPRLLIGSLCVPPSIT